MRLLIEEGGTRLRCPCPVTDLHDASFDTRSGLVECGVCDLLVGQATYRLLLEHRLQHQDLADKLAELEANWDPRDRAARARAAVIEAEYVRGLASLPKGAPA